MPSRTECGLVAVWTAPSVLDPATPFQPFLTPPLALAALRSLQHRGSDTWGLATIDVRTPESISTRVDPGLVPAQEEATVREHGRNLIGALGHVRYATDGGKDRVLGDAHPVMGGSCRGVFAVAFNGHIEGDRLPGDDGDVHRMARHIADHPAPDWGTVLRDILVEVPSAYSLIVLTPSGVWCCRDRYGYKPLETATIYSKMGVAVAYAAASERAAIRTVAEEAGLFAGMETHALAPGGAVWIGNTGITEFRQDQRLLPMPSPRRCSLEAIYFMRPDSRFDALTMDDFRHRCGVALAKEDIRAGVEFDFHRTIVVGCPKSGLVAGRGYAAGGSLVCAQALRVSDRTVRSFIQPTQEARQQAVRKKLYVAGSLAGKDIILVDDSIVRGNSVVRTVQMLREAGARKVHVRIASPPVVNVCNWGVDIPDVEDLFAAKEAPTAERIGADSLRYLTKQQLTRLTGKGWCQACFTSAADAP